MSHHVGYLYWDDGNSVLEVINHARTIEHLRNSSSGCARTSIVGSECAVLYKNPCDYNQTVTFTSPTTPGNPAPWWDGVAGSPSSKALGIWIREWTGLDGTHMSRGQEAAHPRGAVFGPLGQSHRVWRMEVDLFGEDGPALEALFRWLEEMLIGCCSPGKTAWIRTTCPDGYADQDIGLAHVVDVQLLEGLEWEDPPIESLGCFMRRAGFTLGVADPCLYTPPVNTFNESALASVDLCTLGLGAMFACDDQCNHFATWRKTSAVPARQIGVTAPVVVLRNTSTTLWSPPMRVAGFLDPYADGLNTCTQNQTGEVRVAGIPPQSQLMIDCARRRVLWREVGFVRPWEPGYAYLDQSLDRIPDYPSIGCVAGNIIVEPLALTSSVPSLQVTVDLVGRYGCC